MILVKSNYKQSPRKATKLALVEPASQKRWRQAADHFGIGLSALCIVHCLATPILLILLPTLQLFFIREEFHLYLAVILPVTCLAAFIPGYRAHRKYSVFLWAGMGLILIFSALLVPHTKDAMLAESGLSIGGGMALIYAHWTNRKFHKHSCACKHKL